MESAQGAARVRRTVTRHALLVAILLLLVLFALALGSGPRGTGVSLPTVQPSVSDESGDASAPAAPAPSPTPTTGSAAGPPPAAFGYLLGGLLVLVALTLLSLMIRLLLRNRARRWRVRVRQTDADTEAEGAAPTEEAVRDQVLTAVEEGLREADDGDPRRAVIGCWVRLERTAASAGTTRGPGDTPADLVARLLRDHEVPTEALHRLVELYRRARYAPDEVAERMRDEARAALAALASELSGTAS